MSRSITDEAIVLRVYNVGETDRFCILLTKEHGRMTARASGVRRILSRRGQGLLPLHRVNVVWEERSMGNIVSSVQCLDSHHNAWCDPHTFSCVGEGIELLLQLTDDGMPMPEVYALTAEFLRTCSGNQSASVTALFTLKLLKTLGYLPASATTPRDTSTALRTLLDTSDDVTMVSSHDFPDHLASELGVFLSSLLGSQLGVSLKAVPVRRAISSCVTPICQ